MTGHRRTSSTALLPAIALALAVSLGACSDLLGTAHITLEPVRIDTASTPPMVPATVQHGVPFVVEITVWTGSCSTKGPVDIELQGVGILVIPYRKHERKREVLCPGVLLLDTYTVTLEWDRGVAFEVLIYGYDDWTGAPAIFRYPVTVEE